MCVLVVKNEKDGKPLRSKFRIVVLDKFEDRLYQKSQCYALFLKYSCLCLLTARSVGDKRILQQGYFNNAFCNATLPDDEVTLIRPPIGDPDFQDDEYWLLKKKIYGLRRSPHHWYNMIKVIILKMGLNPSPHEPCLLSGVLTNPFSPARIPYLHYQIHVSLYVDNFVFYSSDPSQEALFKTLLQEHIQVDFMGIFDYLLGTAFTWLKHADGDISVHRCQSAFIEFTDHQFSVHTSNKVPKITPYPSRFPIDSIHHVDPLDPDLLRRKQFYQSIVGCNNFLATCTRPDIASALTFLASCSNAPHPQHYKATFHSLKYLTSTNKYGISFHSKSSSTIQAFNHFRHHHDKESYT